MAAGDDEARAEVGGPAEISRLASALNDLAEENARARAIEHRVSVQLMEVDRAKSEFVSNVSHELRTPLTIINGYLELLTDELDDQVTETEAEMFDVTARNVTRLRLLIEDLLELNRTEGPATPQLREVDLVAVLEDVVTDVGLSASSRSVSISLDTGDTPAVVRADPGQLHRAVLNLASNAVKFSRDGSEVRVRMVTTGDEVEVTIADDGIGIPTADQAKVGERFFRASNAVAGEVSGTGLGLRIVKSIVDNHHGTFGLQSVEGKGTTVRLRLPLQRQPAAGRPGPGTGDGLTALRTSQARLDWPRDGPRWQTCSLAPVHVLGRGRPGGCNPERKPMKKDIHPEYVTTEVRCTCGNTFTTRSTKSSGSIRSEVCSNCHPFYTGKQKILDTGGRVARFEARYAKKADKK